MSGCLQSFVSQSSPAPFPRLLHIQGHLLRPLSVIRIRRIDGVVRAAFKRHVHYLGFPRTRRSDKLAIDVSACDLEVRGSLPFILNHERSLPRFEIARHIDLAIVYGHIHSPSIGIGSERVLYLIGRLLHAMRDGCERPPWFSPPSSWQRSPPSREVAPRRRKPDQQLSS